MYVPAHFAASAAEVAELLASMTAVDLITPGPDGLVATFLPMLHDSGSLLGHVARNNPHWQVAASAVAGSGVAGAGVAGAGVAGESLAIVRGPDAYVSPSWYPSKAEHGRVVPTWNYVTAQVFGQLVVHDDVDWLRSLVTRLTERHEDGLAAPWAVADAPTAFIDGQLRAIVGVELVISRIEAKAKLSQNRSAADQAGVVTGLGADSPVGSLVRPS
ncbi:MAG: FMN-binding negative transcriptional regulator [Jatrophihabitantaceae bacterium]